MIKRKSVSLARVAGMLAHTELASTDPEATRRFLEKVFAWEVEEVSAQVAGGDGSSKLIRYQTPGGARGSIRKTGPKEAPATINYILVRDIEAAANRVKRAGGELLMPIVDVPHTGRFFWFKVPGGPMLAAWQDAPDREN